MQLQAKLRRLQHLFRCECDTIHKGMKAATCWCCNLHAALPSLLNEVFPQHYTSAVSRLIWASKTGLNCCQYVF